MFLILSDYTHLTTTELKKHSVDIEDNRTKAESYSQDLIKSYLQPRYDTDKIFNQHQVWSPLSAYVFNDLITIDADDYSTTAIYNINDLIHFTDGNIYIAISTTVAGEDPTNTPAKWTFIGKKDTFYTGLKTSDWVSGTIYNIGDFVVFNKNRYICILTTTGIESPDNGTYFTLDATTIPIGTPPTDTTFWTKGDTRLSIIVKLMVDISKYELTGFINPRNITEKIGIDRDNAIKYLKDIANPRMNICPEFPEKTFLTNQDTSLVWGSNDKIQNGQDCY